MTAVKTAWPWPSGAEQVANDLQLRHELELEVGTFEAAYEMSSAEMCARVDAGDLEEDAELCRWMMDLEMLQALSCAGDE